MTVQSAQYAQMSHYIIENQRLRDQLASKDKEIEFKDRQIESAKDITNIASNVLTVGNTPGNSRLRAMGTTFMALVKEARNIVLTVGEGIVEKIQQIIQKIISFIRQHEDVIGGIAFLGAAVAIGVITIGLAMVASRGGMRVEQMTREEFLDIARFI